MNPDWSAVAADGNAVLRQPAVPVWETSPRTALNTPFGKAKR